MSGAERTQYEAVAIDGDTFVVAADHQPQAGSTRFGKLYVFERTASSWRLEAQLDIGQGASFRMDVDVDGDELVIGHATSNFFAPDASRVDVYQRTAGNWARAATLVSYPERAVPLEVAVDDGTILAKGDDDGVYVFTGTGTTWHRRATLRPEGNQRYAWLATDEPHIPNVTALAIDGNVALVGSAGTSENGREAGSVYLFVREHGVWRQEANILPKRAGDLSSIGTNVALSGKRAMLLGATSTRVDPVGPYVYQIFPGQTPRLFCPGDVDGDGSADLVIVTPEGNVSVKSLDRRQVNWFSLAADGALADAELVSDTNGNGAPELAALERQSAVAELRDLANGGTLGTAAFGAAVTPLDLEVLADRTGNGVPELAALVKYPYAARLRDAMTGETITDVGLGIPNYRIARDLDFFPSDSFPSNRGPEALTVIAGNWSHGADKVDVHDSAGGGTLIGDIWFGGHSNAARQEQVRIPDFNGNGADEVAILTSTEVHVRDLVTRVSLSRIEFDAAYESVRLTAIPDLNENGADELALLSKRPDGTVQRVDIKDSSTGQHLGRLWFDRNFLPIDVVNCGDVNGNGAGDVAVLGERGANGLIKVTVEDTGTGGRLAQVWF